MSSQPLASRRDSGPHLPFAVEELSIEDGLDLAMWRTPGPWSVSDQLEAPPPDEGYWAIRDADGALVGYCCFGEAARVPGLPSDPAMLDVAIGLRPDLIGHGLSDKLARTGVDHGRAVAGDRKLRSVIAQDNAAGRRAAQKAGFRLSGAHEIPGGASVSSYLVFTMP